MRTREEINKALSSEKLELEVLLDIRELLIKICKDILP